MNKAVDLTGNSSKKQSQSPTEQANKNERLCCSPDTVCQEDKNETITHKTKRILHQAAKSIKGHLKRAFIATVTQEYFDGSARSAEHHMGWRRQTIQTGQKELESGIRCVNNCSARGRKKTETLLPQLAGDIDELLQDNAQTDPTLQSTLRYSRITAKAVRAALVNSPNYSEAVLPSRQTIGNILNRRNYRLRKTLKCKPLKKIKETDDIFENVRQANLKSDNDPQSLRISMDCKAKVKIGNLSRGGKSRGNEARKADDHDTHIKDSLVPFGIKEVKAERLTIYFGKSHETSDFIIDCLTHWWLENKPNYPGINELAINVDNGPSVQSHRTQFIKRMIEFSRVTQLRIKLIYYPPYHSKYNPIERCWGALENYWNGALLDSIETAIRWAGNMTWMGIPPIIHVVEKEYQKGVKVCRKEMEKLKSYVKRSDKLPKWDVEILI